MEGQETDCLVSFAYDMANCQPGGELIWIHGQQEYGHFGKQLYDHEHDYRCVYERRIPLQYRRI